MPFHVMTSNNATTAKHSNHTMRLMMLLFLHLNFEGEAQPHWPQGGVANTPET